MPEKLPYSIFVAHELKKRRRSHLISLSKSSELAQSDMVVLVISSHGSFQNGQHVSFSDGQISLHKLIKPVLKKMVGKPTIIFLQSCRGTFHEPKTVQDSCTLYTECTDMPLTSICANSSKTRVKPHYN